MNIWRSELSWSAPTRLTLGLLRETARLRWDMFAGWQALEEADEDTALRGALSRLPRQSRIVRTYRVLTAIVLCTAVLICQAFGVLVSILVVPEASDEQQKAAAWLFTISFIFLPAVLAWGDKKVSQHVKSRTVVLRNLLAGLDPDAIMISYVWYTRGFANGPRRPLHTLPRQLGRLLPEAQTWIDVRRLIPGDETGTQTALAARDALFVFAFVSDSYFESPACLIEWAELRKKPLRSFVAIVVGTFTPARWRHLLPEGRRWEDLNVWTPPNETQIDAEWLLFKLIRAGILSDLLTHGSPAINENWRHTADALSGVRSIHGIVRKTPSASVAVIAAWLWTSSLDMSRAIGSLDGFQAHAVSIVVLSTTALSLVAVGLVQQLMLGSYSLVTADWWDDSDALWLLVCLTKLQIVKPLDVFVSPTLLRVNSTFWDVIARAGCVRFTGADDDVAFRCAEGPSTRPGRRGGGCSFSPAGHAVQVRGPRRGCREL